MRSGRSLKLLLICLLPVSLDSVDSGIARSDTTVSPGHPAQTAAPSDTAVAIRILCTGDIMSHLPVINSARTRNEKKWDFIPLFEVVAPLLKSDDMTIGNLETVLAGDNYDIKGFPDFNAPQMLANGLQSSGFDLLTTCNNHSFDKGLKGLKNTLLHMDSIGLLHTGTFIDSNPPMRSLIVEIKGIRLGILAYADRTNGDLKKRLSRHINLIDTVAILKEIHSLTSQNVHGIIAIMHFGNEYQAQPSKKQKSLVRFLWRNGVQIVFGHHAHVLQPAIFDSATNRFAAFSLGNFFSAQRGGNKEYGGIADITLVKRPKDSIVTIKSAKVIITNLCRWRDARRIRYTVLPLDSAVIFNLPPNYPKYWKRKLDTLPFFKRHLKSLNGKFVYADKRKTDPSAGGR